MINRMLLFGLGAAISLAIGCAGRARTSPALELRSNGTPGTLPARSSRALPSTTANGIARIPAVPSAPQIALAAYSADSDEERAPHSALEQVPPPVVVSVDTLRELEAQAVGENPTLRRLSQEVGAAREKVRYIDRLPDPVVGANIFGSPIETASGSQRANMAVMQTFPSLKRLDAQAQQACFEAMALQQAYRMERLKVIGDLRAAWNRLYVFQKQIETTQSSQELLETIVKRATAIVGAGKGSASDVRMGAIELATLEQRKITLQQQVQSTIARINRLVGRPANTPIESPRELAATLPDWSYEMLSELSRTNQPAIGAAQIRTQATRWGVEVARLQRRPNVTWNASWFAIDDNRPATNLVSVGQDAWSVGAQVSVPIWHDKYDSIQREAQWRHAASHASVDEVIQRYDATVRDLWEQAKAAHETAELYRTTIVPEARRTLDVDTESYGRTDIEFDRVIRDFRTLLTLQLGYDEAIGRLAIAIARIRQAVGAELLGDFNAE